MQGTPLVVPDMRRPAMDDVGITAMSHGSGVERTVQQEYSHGPLLESPITILAITVHTAGFSQK